MVEQSSSSPGRDPDSSTESTKSPTQTIKCQDCGHHRLWRDPYGSIHCEKCLPPPRLAFVREWLSCDVLGASKSIPGIESLTKNSPPQKPSLFTERQWWAAFDRLESKRIDREANEIACKKTQELTGEQNELIAWAKSQIELPIASEPVVSEPITLARHHAIANPIKFITWAVDHLKPRHFRRRCRPPDEKSTGQMQYPPDADEVLKTLAELRQVVEGKQ